MITTLTGANAFGLQQELRRLVAAFQQIHGDISLEKLDGQEISYDRLRESLESLPFLAPRKLVVLRTPSANKDFLEKAAALLEAAPETTDIILIEPKLDKRTAYYKFLKKKSDFKDFPELDESGLVRWLTTAAKEQGGELAAVDARYLVERVGAQQQLLASELAKLLSYDPKITRQTVDLLSEPTPQSSIFELVDAAVTGQTKRAFALYAEQRAMKVEPQQIIAMLGWQLHVLALVKIAGDRDPAATAREARLNPYVVRKSQAVAARLSLAELKALIHRTLQLDINLKSQAIDADEALLHLIGSM